MSRQFILAMLVGALVFLPSSSIANPSTSSPTPRAEAFEAAQWAVSTEAAAALAKVAARFGRSSGPLSELEQHREALIASRDAAEAALIEALAVANGPERAPIEAHIAKYTAEISAVDAQIGVIDPAYLDLTRPKPLSVFDTQALLGADEALLFVLVDEDASYLFAVTHEGFDWTRSEALNASALTKMVQRLRATAQDDVLFKPTGFDRKAAFALYRGLIAPFEPLFASKKRLMTVATGPLDALPLAMLVTSEPKGSDTDAKALQGTAWLADRYALSTLPAVSSLRALRCLLAPANQRSAGCRGPTRADAETVPGKHLMFAGIGAPLLNGKSEKPERGKARGVQVTGSDRFNASLADVEFLRGLTYLAGSKKELETLGAEFPPQAAMVLTGADAREDFVRQSPEIGGAQYLVFSTHGLLASQSSVAGEPGLVFTPPKQATEQDDGLLTASEVAQMHLSAQLVVLSACNTAASNGQPAAEGLSGLARAFLFAGARSLVVSHWEVSDESTPPLMAELFRQAGVNDVGTAEALQAAMKKVRDNAEWASPGFWGAFALIGTGD